MKKLGFICCLFLSAACLMAQAPAKSKKSDKRWHELEMNSVFLLQEIFGNRKEEDLQNAYLVGYKTGKGNVGLRFGLGAGFNLRKERESVIDTRDLNAYTIRARFGLEWRKNLLERWQLISGIDGVVESIYKEDITTTSFDKLKTKEEELAIGGGPVLGLRFWLNTKISIATETGFQAFYVRKIDSIDSENLPDFDSKKVTIEYPIRFSPPVNLYLLIRFK